MSRRPPRLLVDVTNSLAAPTVTGIQRVTIELVARLADRGAAVTAATPDGPFELVLLQEREPRAGDDSIAYAVLPAARAIAAMRAPAAARRELSLVPVAHVAIEELEPGSVFLDVDAAWHDRVRRDRLYPALARQGVAVLALHYDAVPLHRPELVHPDTLAKFLPHVEAQLRHADRLLAISGRVREDLLEAARERGLPVPPVDVLRLGADHALGGIAEAGSQLPPEIGAGRPYLLAVGTLEPRKNHRLLLDVFDRIAADLPELGLVLVGREGWMVDELVARIRSHPLLGTRLHWLERVSDAMLAALYRGALLSVVPSLYEGYGLPVVEALARGAVTLASDRGALVEAGQGLADHFDPQSPDELEALVRRYATDAGALAARRAEVAAFEVPSWDDAAASVVRAAVDLAAGARVRSESAVPRSIVYLSINPGVLRETLVYVEHRMPWIEEALVVAPAGVAPAFSSSGRLPLTVLTDDEVLGEDAALFAGADHQGKNWLLRRGIVRHPRVPGLFVMSDDDYRPLRPIPPSFFVRDGRHQAYYFHDLEDWPSRQLGLSPYDRGIRNAHALLTRDGIAAPRAFSSHCPQVIDKAIYVEMLERFGEEARRLPVDEWSIYFNHALERHPERFEARAFRTLCWPALPTDWEGRYAPEAFDFENYYPLLYEPGQPFAGLPDRYADDDLRCTLEKVTRRLRLQADYDRNRELRDASLRRARERPGGVGGCHLAIGPVEIELHGVPARLECHPRACTKLMLRMGVIAAEGLRALQLRHEVFALDGSWLESSHSPVDLTGVAAGFGGIVEVPIVAPREEGIYRLTFHLRADGGEILQTPSDPPHVALHVVPSGAAGSIT